jgi:arginyl-tRNA synthetase
MLANIQEDLLSFGIQMDYFASERTLLANRCVENMLAKFREKGMINERDGALWFCSDKFGDEKERVLVKKDGTNTYFATDIANHIDKLKRGFDLLINVWGADHHGYVPRMNAAIQALGERADVLDVVLVQMVSLLRDKKPVVLSKRAGEIITLRDVIDEVGRDAARFFFIMRTCASQMDFDLELAKKHSLDNPVYYVQYAYARLASILARAREKNFNVPDPKHAKEIDLSSLDLPEELRLIKKMSGFSEYIRHAADSRAPHLVVIFLQDLVREFHSYYTKYAQMCPILKGSSEHITARLILVQALQQVLHNGLRLLGVSAPKRMEPPKEA